MHDDQENEFVRTPILQNKVFFFVSRCAQCSYFILASSAYELIDLEEQHALECKSNSGFIRLESGSA